MIKMEDCNNKNCDLLKKKIKMFVLNDVRWKEKGMLIVSGVK